MPETLEHDLERYFFALAERVDRAAEVPTTAHESPRRGRWLAMAAACLLLVGATVALVVSQAGEDTSPDPATTGSSAPPTPTTAPSPTTNPSNEDEPSTSPWREPTVDPAMAGPYEAVWTGRREFAAIPTSGPVIGRRIEPQTMRITPMPAAPFGPREDPTVVWTGREVLVVGGNPSPEPRGAAYSVDEPLGGAYDPTEDTWRPIEVPREVLTNRTIMRFGDGVWNGSELVFWTIGWAYDPEGDTWRPMSTPPLDFRSNAASVAIGANVLVWGGCEPIDGCEEDAETWLDDGALWSAATDTWERLPQGPLDAAPGAIAVADATGATIVGLNVLDDGGGRNLVARYEPGVGWIDLPDPSDAPWVGSDLTQVGPSVVLSGWADSNDGQWVVLHPGADQWEDIPTPRSERKDHSLADGEAQLLVIGGTLGPSTVEVLPVEEAWSIQPEPIEIEIRVEMRDGVPFAVRTFPDLPPEAVYTSLWYDGRLVSRGTAIVGSTGGTRLPEDPAEFPIEAQIVIEDIDMYPIAATEPVLLTIP